VLAGTTDVGANELVADVEAATLVDVEATKVESTGAEVEATGAEVEATGAEVEATGAEVEATEVDTLVGTTVGTMLVEESLRQTPPLLAG